MWILNFEKGNKRKGSNYIHQSGEREGRKLHVIVSHQGCKKLIEEDKFRYRDRKEEEEEEECRYHVDIELTK